MTLTREEIERLKALAEQATPGPWGVGTVLKQYVYRNPGSAGNANGFRVGHVDDAAFIAACRESIPALCALALEQMDLLEKLKCKVCNGKGGRIETVGDDDTYWDEWCYCHDCDGTGVNVQAAKDTVASLTS